jgi:hypothetical protein
MSSYREPKDGDRVSYPYNGGFIYGIVICKDNNVDSKNTYYLQFPGIETHWVETIFYYGVRYENCYKFIFPDDRVVFEDDFTVDL